MQAFRNIFTWKFKIHITKKTRNIILCTSYDLTLVGAHLIFWYFTQHLKTFIPYFTYFVSKLIFPLLHDICVYEMPWTHTYQITFMLRKKMLKYFGFHNSVNSWHDLLLSMNSIPACIFLSDIIDPNFLFDY